MMTDLTKSELLNLEHAKLVSGLTKPGADIAAQMTDEKANLLHMVVGIAGEAGELLDGIKKHVIYQQPLDLVNTVEELGDLEFYMQGLRAEIKVSRDAVLEFNTKKLSERYSSGAYTDWDAIRRADKK